MTATTDADLHLASGTPRPPRLPPPPLPPRVPEPLPARVAAPTPRVVPAPEAAEAATFETLYQVHFAFVWRSVRRLGVVPSAVDDAVQEVFVVVHRRLASLAPEASVRAWLFAIVRRVVADHRRGLRRKPGQLGSHAAVELHEHLREGPERGPHELLVEQEAFRALHAILDTLDDDKRQVLVLAELEQMTAPQIAEATETNVNTIYGRLRAARQAFEEAAARFRARDTRRLP